MHSSVRGADGRGKPLRRAGRGWFAPNSRSRSRSGRSCSSPASSPLAWALASIANVLLMIFVSVFSVAVLSPVVTAMERRFGWSRRLCSTVLVLGIVIVIGAVVLVRGAGDQRRSARVQRRPATDRGQGQAQRSGQLHQRRERLARHVEAARERHHQRGGQGVGRRRPRRRLGLRRGHARLLGHLPDAFRADRRTAPAGLDRQSALSGQAGALPAGHGPDHPDRPRATCSATWPSP